MFWKTDGVCLGIILRRDREFPANKAMEEFFVPQGDKYRGRPITTLPVVLNNDLSRLESSTYCLKTFKDIENLKKIAEQRDQWRILCTRIQKAAEALQSGDYDAERDKSSYLKQRYRKQYRGCYSINKEYFQGQFGFTEIAKDFNLTLRLSR